MKWIALFLLLLCIMLVIIWVISSATSLNKSIINKEINIGQLKQPQLKDIAAKLGINKMNCVVISAHSQRPSFLFYLIAQRVVLQNETFLQEHTLKISYLSQTQEKLNRFLRIAGFKVQNIHNVVQESVFSVDEPEKMLLIYIYDQYIIIEFPIFELQRPTTQKINEYLVKNYVLFDD